MPPKKRALFNTGKLKATGNKPIAVPPYDALPNAVPPNDFNGQPELQEINALPVAVPLIDVHVPPISEQIEETGYRATRAVTPKRKLSVPQKVTQAFKKVKAFFSPSKKSESQSSSRNLSPVAGPSNYKENTSACEKWDTDEESDSQSEIKKLHQDWDSDSSDSRIPIVQKNDHFTSDSDDSTFNHNLTVIQKWIDLIQLDFKHTSISKSSNVYDNIR